MPFGSLWLPVVVATLAVWVASAVLHMALKYHKADYRGVADEEAVGAALRKAAPTPGFYVIPHCPDPSQLKDPAVIQRFETGPVALIAVMKNGAPSLAKNLVQWVLFCFLVSFVSAYVARQTLTPGTAGLTVCRITGTVAFTGYGIGLLQESIWKGVPWSNTLRGMVDAAIYAALTGLVFAWLFPAG